MANATETTKATKAKDEEKKTAAAAAPATATQPAAKPAVAVPDGFLPQGWKLVDTTGPAIFKPELAVAEGKALQGIPFDVILALGGASDCGVWEAIVFEATAPTIGIRGEEQVEIAVGETVMIATNAMLAPIAQKALAEKRLVEVKLQPTEKKEHATNKKWSYWEFIFAIAPHTVDREARGLYRSPERLDILAKLAAYEKSLGGRPPREKEDVKILNSYHFRMRALEAQNGGSFTLPELPAAS